MYDTNRSSKRHERYDAFTAEINALYEDNRALLIKLNNVLLQETDTDVRNVLSGFQEILANIVVPLEKIGNTYHDFMRLIQLIDYKHAEKKISDEQAQLIKQSILVEDMERELKSCQNDLLTNSHSMNTLTEKHRELLTRVLST